LYRREEAVEVPSVISTNIEKVVNRLASESRILKSRHLLENSMQVVGRDIVFKPVLPTVLMPSESKGKDNTTIRPNAKA
jgi:hypothetical protein